MFAISLLVPSQSIGYCRSIGLSPFSLMSLLICSSTRSIGLYRLMLPGSLMVESANQLALFCS